MSASLFCGGERRVGACASSHIVVTAFNGLPALVSARDRLALRLVRRSDPPSVQQLVQLAHGRVSLAVPYIILPA